MDFIVAAWESVSTALSRQLFMFGNAPITLSQVIAAPVIIVIGLLIARLVERGLSRRMLNRGMDNNLVLLVRRGFWVVIIATLLLLALSILNVPLGAFTFISGAVAIGVGFGAQAIINNFISGWIIMGERPIRIGDLLEFEGTIGRVEDINTRATRIRRIDGVHFVTPNSFFIENTIINWTLVNDEIRTVVRVGVAYGSPVRQVEALMLQAAKEHEGVMPEPAPHVIFEEFGDNALVFDLFVWTLLRPGGDLRVLRSDLRFRITELFQDNGIVIAFPQRDVHLDGELRLTDGRGERSEPAVAHEEQDLEAENQPEHS